MISHGTNTFTLMTNSFGESRHVGHSIIHFKSIVIMIAYAIYTIITLICIRSHICSFILRFSYFSTIHIFLYFSHAYIYLFIYSYIPIIHVQVLIHVFCHLLLIPIVLSNYAFLSCVPSMFHLFI